VIWSSTTTLRSYSASVSLTGYANGYLTSGNYIAGLESSGVYIYSDSNLIKGYTDVNITGIDMRGIGIYLAGAGGQMALLLILDRSRLRPLITMLTGMQFICVNPLLPLQAV